MAQYLKINSKVLNADTVIAAVRGFGTSDVKIITTETQFDTVAGVEIYYWLATTSGSSSSGLDLVKDINAALTANPGGRVVEVPTSSDYTITSLTYELT